MRSLLAVALTLLVAGCVASPLTASKLAGAPSATAFAAKVGVIDVAGGRGEPSLGVAPDGTLYTNRGGTVLQSKDDGTTWKDLGDPTAPMPDADADLVVDKDGTIWDDTLYVGCATAASSRDEGKTWTKSVLACVPPAGDRQYVVPTQKGTAYIYSHHVPTFYQTIAKTTDYGATWTPVGIAEGPLALAQPGGESGWGGGGFWNERKDSVALTYSWYHDVVEAQVGTLTTRWNPAVSITHDQGRTWTMTLVPNAKGTALGLSLVVGAADKAGNAYLAWGEAHGDDVAIYLSVSHDDGRTWSPTPILVDGDAGSKVFPAIAAHDDGHVAIAYYHADQRGYPSAVPATTAWNVTLAWTDDANAAVPTFQHADLSTHPARIGPICPDGTLCQGNRQLLDYFALRATPDGRVASVWTSTSDVAGKTVNVLGVTSAPLLAAK